MKKLMAFLLAISLIAVSLPVMVFAGNDGLDKPQQKGKFSDTAGHWAENVIEKMADSGIIRGVGNGKFLPDVQMKRSEFVVALHKAAEIQIYYIKAPNINEFFDDANNEDWFASSLYDLASLKIVDDEDREFRPNDFITREEMVHYLMNAYRYKLNIENFDEDDDAFEDFSDWKNVKQRYKKSVKRAYKLGFIKGRGNRMFVPEGFTTRAEALIVLDKLMEAFKDALKDVVEQPVEAVKVEPSFVKVEDGYEMRLTISNNSKKDIVINHNSGQKYDFMLLDDKKEELYRWSQDMAFILPLIDTTIEAGKTVEFTQKIDFKTYESIEDKVYYFKALIVGDSKDFKINKDGYYLSLKEKKENSLLVEPEYEKSKNTFTMKLKLQNTSDKDITINHTSSQKFDFKLLDKNKEILYTWSADKLFMAMLTETVIGAGKTVEFEEELDMESYKDIIGKAKYLKAYIVGTSEDCELEKDGYEVEIK